MSKGTDDALSEVLPYLIVDGHAATIKAADVRLERLLGYGPGELIGQDLNVLIPERSRADHDQDRAAYMLSPTPRRMGPEREVWMRKKDDHEVLVWIGLAPNGKTGDIVAAVLPMGEISRGEHALNPHSERKL